MLCQVDRFLALYLHSKYKTLVTPTRAWIVSALRKLSDLISDNKLWPISINLNLLLELISNFDYSLATQLPEYQKYLHLTPLSMLVFFPLWIQGTSLPSWTRPIYELWDGDIYALPLLKVPFSKILTLLITLVAFLIDESFSSCQEGRKFGYLIFSSVPKERLW